MIMLLTHRSEIREQLNATLQDKGYDTCVPPHRQDVMAAMKERHPQVIILDLYLSEPSGIQTLRSLRQDGSWESRCPFQWINGIGPRRGTRFRHG